MRVRAKMVIAHLTCEKIPPCDNAPESSRSRGPRIYRRGDAEGGGLEGMVPRSPRLRGPWWLWPLLLVIVPACSRGPHADLLPGRIAARELTHLGLVYQVQGDDARALQAYHQAVQMNPNYVPAWFALGNFHYVRREYAQAEVVYKKILTLDPRMAEIYHNLCQIYLSTHRNLDDAEDLIQRALALNPSPRYVYLDTQAAIWIAQGKYEQALVPLHEAIQLTPTLAHEALAARYEHLAEVYRHLGQEREAQWAGEEAAKARRTGH